MTICACEHTSQCYRIVT